MSRLLNRHSPGFRSANMARNYYNNNNDYNVSHSRAISDGDEHGKGEHYGSIGSSTDIITRNTSMARNIFNRNNPYDASNA